MVVVFVVVDFSAVSVVVSGIYFAVASLAAHAAVVVFVVPAGVVGSFAAVVVFVVSVAAGFAGLSRVTAIPTAQRRITERPCHSEHPLFRPCPLALLRMGGGKTLSCCSAHIESE